MQERRSRSAPAATRQFRVGIGFKGRLTNSREGVCALVDTRSVAPKVGGGEWRGVDRTSKKYELGSARHTRSVHGDMLTWLECSH